MNFVERKSFTDSVELREALLDGRFGTKTTELGPGAYATNDGTTIYHSNGVLTVRASREEPGMHSFY
jgi:hypothetical protein